VPYVLTQADQDKHDKRSDYRSLHVKYMKNRYGAEPWSYMEDRDPEVLKNYNGFGLSLFVVRHEGTVNKFFKEIFKDVITNDPGLNVFKVYYCMGTGDVFYLGSSASNNIRFWHTQMSKIQHKIDTEINEHPQSIELKDKTVKGLKEMSENHSESESDRIEIYEEYKSSCEDYEAFKQQLRVESPRSKEIENLQKKINYVKDKLHQQAIRFETSFKVNLDPQFKADQRLLKKGPKQLEKSWKQTASDLAHAKCRQKVIRATGRLGKSYVPVGEACSTMVDPVCLTLHSPGVHHLHSCPGCQSTTIRDESGRAIGQMACVAASYALGKLNKSDHLNGQTFVTNRGQSNGDSTHSKDFW
jgi:hypothetical protein